MKRLGVIVNPVAGVGGRVGLKGSDGAEVLRRALELGAAREAPRRAQRALERLARLREQIEIVAWPGEMGEVEARAAGWEPTVVGSLAGRRSYVLCELDRTGERPRITCDDFVLTTPEDSQAAARDLLAAGVDLILFAGGDGTARAIRDAVGTQVPVIGVPAGVKIHSAVYAATPAAAGDLAALYLHDKPAAVRLRECEVMDIDEEAFRDDRVSARLYGYLEVPFERTLLQSAKAGGVAGDAVDLAAIATDVVNGMTPGTLYLLGPGTTVRAVADRLGLPKTLLGVDAVRDRAPAGADLSERQILEALDALEDPGAGARIVVTVIGGQGHIFGRGNQQLSPPRSSAAWARATSSSSPPRPSCSSLGGGPLLVDTGDEDLDRELAGYARVVTGLAHSTMYKVAAAGEE